MEIGLYEAVSGMKAQSAYQDILSANLARSNVPGSKQVLTAFEIPPSSSLQQANNLPGTTESLGLQAAAPLQARSVIDFSPGLLHPTGNSTDFAIEGDAFFKVRESNGDIAYTRNGQFRLNANGVLVTGDGAEVLMNNDVPLNLKPTDGNRISISSTGQVKVGPNSTSRGSLALVHMDDPRTVLTMGSGGRFRAADGTDSQIQSGLGKHSFVRQGFLEDGNANPVSSMISLVQVVRSYEANQKSVTMQDSVTGEMIQSAADTSSTS